MSDPLSAAIEELVEDKLDRVNDRLDDLSARIRDLEHPKLPSLTLPPAVGLDVWEENAIEEIDRIVLMHGSDTECIGCMVDAMMGRMLRGMGMAALAEKLETTPTWRG